MRSFDRWQTLTRDQWRLTVKSSMVIAAAVASIRLLGVERALRLSSRRVRGSTLRLAPLAQDRTKNVIGDVVTSVDRAGRYVPGGTCLPKSLALAWMLRGMGVAATVRIGVRTAGQFEAHAWVECNGVAVETVPPGYTPILNR